MKHLSIVVISCLFLFASRVYPAGSTAYQYNKSGIKHLESGEYKEAVADFEHAYDREPDNTVIRNNLAAAYMRLAGYYAGKENLSGAVSFAEKAVALSPENKIFSNNLSVFYYNRAYQYMKEMKAEQAVAGLKRSLRYNGESWQAYVLLGKICYEQGKTDEAAVYWEKALALNNGLHDIEEKLNALKAENAVTSKFRKKRFDNFEIRYEGYEEAGLAGEVLDILREASSKLGYDFRYYPKAKVPVIVYTKEQFSRITSEPGWIGGLFDGIIRLPAVDIRGRKNELRRIVYHEYTHALLYQKMGDSLPVWLNEGLAQFKEPKSRVTRDDISFLKKYARERGIVGIKDLDRVFSGRQEEERLRLAYLEAKLLVKYFDERYGFYRIRALLDELSLGKDVDSSLRKIFYLNLDDMEKSWIRWLKDKRYL